MEEGGGYLKFLCCKRRNHDESRPEEMRPLVNRNHRRPELPQKDYESLDYHQYYNEPYGDYLETQNRDLSETKVEVIKWIVTFFVGFLTAMVALFIDVIIKILSKLKFDTVEHYILDCPKELIVPLLFLLLFNVGFVFVSSGLTVIEPVAAGSGIPEIKCYLNGIKIPRVVRLRTVVAKAVGVLFSVAGGLFVGKEGPMIHSGAVIGAGVPQFQSIALGWKNVKYSFFRTDRDKRDFVAGGAAAGVAAAFGAPIGGVLFSLEEGCSFWNQKLTWRTFFCSMAATFSLNFFLSGLNDGTWGYFYLPGLINFGEFKCNNTDTVETSCRLWNAVDLLLFVVMGAIGGLLGALFNKINTMLTVCRMRYLHSKNKIFRIAEAVVVAAVTTTVAFVAAMKLGKCRENTQNTHNLTADVIASYGEGVRTYFCDKGYYNDMATLFFNSQEVAIKQLFHQEGTFSMQSLAIFFIFFFLLACWTYGVTVPSGLFVPSLLCGAAYGRFVASLITDVIGYDHQIYSGTFALVGAASFLGGVVRMTISLTVILIESTNEISYGLPIMLALMVAKWSGDLFNEGLYDIHIKLKSVPFLEWDTPRNVFRLKARDVMEGSVVYIYKQTHVSVLEQILKTTVHNAYPIVEECFIDSKRNNISAERDEITQEPDSIRCTRKRIFRGIILRSQLVVLMKHEMYASTEQKVQKLLRKYREDPPPLSISNSVRF